MDEAPLVDHTLVGAAQLVQSLLTHKLHAFDRNGKVLGTVEQFVTDMRSGKVEYVVLSFGGFLGIGQKYHPVPFASLRINSADAGYVVDMDEKLIDGSPSYRPDDAPVFDESYGQRITSYYSTALSDA